MKIIKFERLAINHFLFRNEEISWILRSGKEGDLNIYISLCNILKYQKYFFLFSIFVVLLN